METILHGGGLTQHPLPEPEPKAKPDTKAGKPETKAQKPKEDK